MVQHWRHTCGRVLLLVFTCVPALVLGSEDDGEPPPQAEQAVHGRMVEEESFDQMVFQGSPDAATGRARIVAHLKLKLEEVNRVCTLNPDQTTKLSLAGQGDIKRFLDQVEALRVKFLEIRNDQNRMNQFWQQVAPLQQKQTAGLFGESSIFAKTLSKTLTDDQRNKYRGLVDERRMFRYRAMIEVSLINMDETVALRRDQHEALTKLMLEQTKPPLAFGQYDSHYVMYAMAKIPSQKIQPLLDATQWKQLQQQIQQSRGMEGFLAQNGVIDSKGVAAPPGGGGAGGIFGFVFGGNGVRVEAANRVDAAPVDEDAPANALRPENRRNRIRQ